MPFLSHLLVLSKVKTIGISLDLKVGSQPVIVQVCPQDMEASKDNSGRFLNFAP